jgi:hypothetical protein
VNFPLVVIKGRHVNVDQKHSPTYPHIIFPFSLFKWEWLIDFKNLQRNFLWGGIGDELSFIW